ncbi:replication terminator protein [Lacticaseibacillus saniviri]
MNENITLNLTDLANGAVQEKLVHAVEKVANNILDPNTDAKKARKITLGLTFKPNENRDTINLDVDVKESLAPEISVATTVLVGRDDKGKTVAKELKSGVAGQEYFDPEDSTLKHDDGEPVTDDAPTNEPIDFRKAQQGKAN